MRGKLITMAAALLALGLLCSAKPGKGTDFAAEGPLRFGMEISAAEKLIAGKDWKVTYRVDTPSTSEIACVYRDEVFYLIGFFEGKCYSVEKRVHADKAEVERVFDYYAAQLGETGEATQSDDGSLYFARWDKERREISLTADQGSGDVYKLTYEEEDILTVGDARRAQMDELGSQPQAVDPITGKARILPQGEGDTTGDGGDAEGDDSGDSAAGESGDDNAGDGNSGEEGKPPPPTKVKDGEKSGEGSGDSGEKKDPPKKRPRINPKGEDD